jgi:uncharacterized membrane protein YhaH (DUF805 family)
MTTAPAPISVARPKLVSPGRFLLIGVSLFLLKFVIDRLVAGVGFGREWSLRSYLIPEQAYSPASLRLEDKWFLLAMLGVTVPFVVVGLTMTVRRLRDAGLSLRLAPLFFVPFINLLFFAILSLLPSLPVAGVAAESGAAPQSTRTRDGRGDFLDRLLPLSSASSFLVSSLFVLPLGPMTVGLGVFVLRNYGWGLFVGLPFVAGLLATVLHTHRARRSFWSCALVSILALFACGIGIFFCAMEGAVCLIMLFPLAVPIALAGAAVGYSIQRRPATSIRGFPVELMGLLIVLPLLMGAERLVRPEAQLFAVTTSVEVDAPPEAVWRNVVTFSEIAPPKEWFFATGVAYPVRARIEGTGVGACRYCEFSTGPFIEPITAWDEPKLLKFDVTQNPPPMREWGPFDIHPPHLENYLQSQGGQFHLIALPGGRTRLEGTTWYQHHMFPEAYWRFWGDYVIHKIHRRVLEHVKRLSEAR